MERFVDGKAKSSGTHAAYKLQRSAPEAQGVSSKAIAEWLKALDKLRFPNSFMLMRHGHVIAEGWWSPYSPEARHQLFSLSKSFASIAIGLAIEERLLKLDDCVAGYFPEALPKGMPDAFLRMTVRHLLTMSTGHGACPFWEMLKAGDCVRAFFASKLEFEPGSRFVYNSAATYMLSAIISRLTGQTLLDYLNPRLLRPLGIFDAHWDACPKGMSLGGWGFHLSTEEIANFAQMLLDKGRWNGRQLVPEAYIGMASSFQIDNSMNDQPDWKLGYGFQFWRSRRNSFRADGAFGQYALVMPDFDMALAMTSGMSNMQSVLTATWETLLPGVEASKIADDPSGQAELAALAKSLRIPSLEGISVPPPAPAAYEIKGNSAGVKRISFSFSKDCCEMKFETGSAVQTLRAGFEERIFGKESLFYNEPRKAACSAAWKCGSHLEIQCCYYETPFIVAFNCRFEGGALRLESSSDLKFGTSDWETLYGLKAPVA